MWSGSKEGEHPEGGGEGKGRGEKKRGGEEKRNRMGGRNSTQISSRDKLELDKNVHFSAGN